MKLVGALAKAEEEDAVAWAAKHDLGRYFASSIKGTAEMDWSDKDEREAFLTGIVADARRLLQVAKGAVSDHGMNSEIGRSVSCAAELLCMLLVQDVKEKPDGKWTLVECDRAARKRGQKGSQYIDIWKLRLDGSHYIERVTYFSDYPGYKATNPVVSDDGRFMAFQMAKIGDPGGVGRGIFIYDFGKAKKP